LGLFQLLAGGGEAVFAVADDFEPFGGDGFEGGVELPGLGEFGAGGIELGLALLEKLKALGGEGVGLGKQFVTFLDNGEAFGGGGFKHRRALVLMKQGCFQMPDLIAKITDG
jgi:hypothetical protein